MFKLVLEKAEEPEIKLPNSLDHRRITGIPKNIYFCFINYPKAFDCVNHDKRWKILKEMGVPEPLTASRETGMQVKKQQLEPNMEQWIGSKLALLI